MNYGQESLKKHLKFNGKLDIVSKVPLENKDDLSIYYTPGVAEPCRKIAENPDLVYDYTRKNNTIAIVSDGSAVLGLGNIGAEAGLPVMEGKSLLLKKFGSVNAVPIMTKTQDPDKIIELAENISPGFGGIFLEDISAPNCFYIEEELKKRLSVPVFHDDQHGTAIVVLAGLINTLKITGKKIDEIKVVTSGAGAAGIACAKLMINYGVKNLIMLDSKGSVNSERSDLNKYKSEFVKYNLKDEKGGLAEVIQGADVFVGVSKAGILTKSMVETMNDGAAIFAMANPDPEITPDEAKAGGAYIIATGRSDFPNQINNVLAFPGLRRGILDARIPQITEEHKIACAEIIANYIENPTTEEIIPSALNTEIPKLIAKKISSMK